MRGRLTRQGIRLRLLALVLAAALGWYTINPAPGPVRRAKRDEGPPDEKRREAKPPRPKRLPSQIGAAASASGVLPALDEDVDDLEWPEVIGAE